MSDDSPEVKAEPHRHREIAESFGSDPARYDRARPPYPEALIRRVIASSPGNALLDVGCGTGIEARQFQAAGCTVLGIEPDARMAAFARERGVDVEVAKFEGWEPAGRQFDAVVAGTAWHWVDPIAGAAKAAEVLRPAGLIAPFHHVFQYPPDVLRALSEAFLEVVPDSPFNLGNIGSKPAVEAYQPLFDKIADGIRAAHGFTDPNHWLFEWERTYSKDEWLDQLPTHGNLTQLPPQKLATVLDRVGTAIDKLGGRLTMPYATVAVTARRIVGE